MSWVADFNFPTGATGKTPDKSGKGEDIQSVGSKAKQRRYLVPFKPLPVEKYDDSSILEEFISLYNSMKMASGGDDAVKAHYLLMCFTGTARSWLMNLHEDTIYNWKKLKETFIGNFQGTWTHLPTSDTLRTLKQKRDESLKDFMTWFCKVCNEIIEIDDIEVIIAFKDTVTDVKTVEMLT